MTDAPHFVVVGIDGSESSRDALRWAARQAELTGATLVVALAWHLPAAACGPLPLPTGVDWALDASTVLHDTITSTLGEKSLVHVRPVLLEGPAASELVQLAKDADLLVLGSRGHGAFTGMLLGSVSEHCVAHATCPVVVVRGLPDAARGGLLDNERGDRLP